MKTLKHIALAFVLLAQTVIMAHNAIPHHHHDGHEHHCTETCCHDHGSDGTVHICDSHSCGQCRLLEDLFDSHSPSFGQTILTATTAVLPGFSETECGYADSACRTLHRQSLSSGLRAPPFFM